MMANGGTALARGTNISEIEGVPPERGVWKRRGCTEGI
jgi:hypothetical protein